MVLFTRKRRRNRNKISATFTCSALRFEQVKSLRKCAVWRHCSDGSDNEHRGNRQNIKKRKACPQKNKCRYENLYFYFALSTLDCSSLRFEQARSLMEIWERHCSDGSDNEHRGNRRKTKKTKACPRKNKCRYENLYFYFVTSTLACSSLRSKQARSLMEMRSVQTLLRW